jgi:hypothetical protein
MFSTPGDCYDFLSTYALNDDYSDFECRATVVLILKESQGSRQGTAQGQGIASGIQQEPSSLHHHPNNHNRTSNASRTAASANTEAYSSSTHATTAITSASCSNSTDEMTLQLWRYCNGGPMLDYGSDALSCSLAQVI